MKKTVLFSVMLAGAATCLAGSSTVSSANAIGLMEVADASRHAQNGVARFDSIARIMQPLCFAAQALRDAFHLVHACHDAGFAGEVFHHALLGGNAQNLAGQIDVGHIFRNEIVQACIGDSYHVRSLSLLSCSDYSVLLLIRNWNNHNAFPPIWQDVSRYTGYQECEKGAQYVEDSRHNRIEP